MANSGTVAVEHAISAVVLGAADLDKTVAFYRDIVGLDVAEEGRWDAAAFRAVWPYAEAGDVPAVVLEQPGVPVGRVIVLGFGSAAQTIRQPEERRGYGHLNLNLYAEHIFASTDAFKVAGYMPWSEPTGHDLSEGVGSPIEVMCDGPDGLVINMIQLATTDPASQIGQMRAYLKREGYTRTGLTPIVTAEHVVRDRAAATAFHRDVLGMTVFIDEVLDKPETNHFLDLPDGSKTHVTFLKGEHMFGKVCLSDPLNYVIGDLVPRARPPAAGYMAQVFRVGQMPAGAPSATALSLPGFGDVNAVSVPAPGSGAAMILAKVA